MSYSKKSHLKTLIRRKEHLQSRMASSPYGKLDHDRREHAALSWAINTLMNPSIGIKL